LQFGRKTAPYDQNSAFNNSVRGLVAYTNQLNQITYYGYDEAMRKTWETNANNEIIRYTNNAAGDLLSLTDGKNQTTRWKYDEYGRVTNKLDQAGVEILRYKYDPAQYSASWRSTFIYDGLGRLRTRSEYYYNSMYPGGWVPNGTTLYVYDGMRVIQERPSAPAVSYTRGNDLSGSVEGAGGIGGLLARSHGYASSNGNWYVHNCYQADGNGNITYLVNSSQGLAAKYRYDPYGNTISSSGNLAYANMYRFSSKEFHLNSGLYYYGYRWYHPNLQRWLSVDPLGESGFETMRSENSSLSAGGLNLYEFAANDPIRFIDALGNSCIDPCGLARAMGLAGTDPAGVICCGGEKYSCVWKPGGASGAPGLEAQAIITDCARLHEDSHHSQVECPLACFWPTREPYKPPFDENASECSAYQKHIRCLQDGLRRCGSDRNCFLQLYREIQEVMKIKDEYCSKVKK